VYVLSIVWNMRVCMTMLLGPGESWYNQLWWC